MTKTVADDMVEVPEPKQPKVLPSAAQFQSGPPIAPVTRVLTYDDTEWEKFIEEWVSACLKTKYKKVLRASGANDHGVDVAGFADDQHLKGVWDNYQCKHYDHPIMPSEAWPEIGKILWYSFQGLYVPPRKYFFVAPRSCGTTLSQLLSNTPLLKQRLIEAWDGGVRDKITNKQQVILEGEFGEYVIAFDFSIFQPPLQPLEIIEQHKASPYHAARFGGGLPPRPVPGTPPAEVQEGESVYVGRLLEAYADHTKQPVANLEALKAWQSLSDHFKRQRESFYHAESFRVFVRDKVEPGTFEGLQDEVYHGVVDACEACHPDGFERVKAVTLTAQSISLDAHPLGSSAGIRDRHGICHQLANEERLKWTK